MVCNCACTLKCFGTQAWRFAAGIDVQTSEARLKSCKEEGTEGPMVEGRVVEGPTVEGPTVQGPVIRTIHQVVQGPIRSTVRDVERNSSSKFLRPVIRNSCVWNASKNREVKVHHGALGKKGG